MSVRAIQDQKVPAGAQRGNIIASIEMQPDSILDDAEEKEQFHAKSNHASEVGRLAIKAKGRVLFVDPIDVVVARAQGNYVALVHKSGSYLVRETMATAEQKLTPLGFVRIHRSILVNTALVKDLRRDSTGTYVLRTTDGNEHRVGRAYKDNLKVIARSWLGVELV
jgi:DNA-binding LytR/AlgR family response regulator